MHCKQNQGSMKYIIQIDNDNTFLKTNIEKTV